MESSRYRIVLDGAVQGVGFRPFVYRLATSLALTGYVETSRDGLVIEVEGDADRLDRFTDRLSRERPPASRVTLEHVSHVAPLGTPEFVIAGSQAAARAHGGMLTDLAACADCVREITDRGNRRHGYPFTSCALCGPRFTITERLPYDRGSSTMRRFTMCRACRREYDTASDRRYHAQPNACPRCGPALSAPIGDIARALRGGSIVALKGIGGFHLLCDARDEGTVARLRRRKAREHTPFPVMMPSLGAAQEYCVVDVNEAAALTSRAAPIVLLRPRRPSGLAAGVSGGAPLVGVVLPYSPLHHLLMREVRRPLVATSGNAAGDPIVVDDEEARARLGSIADLIVTHTRPIARPCDDSVVRVTAGGPAILRRARGYAPLPIDVGVDLPAALAVGGHARNTIAIGVGRSAVVSQHLGDLDTAAARRGFAAAVDDLCGTYAFAPKFVVADRHPGYASRQWADASGYPVVEVQHHHAHVASCAAENGVVEPYLGVAWDRGGRGDEGAVWGGEFFAVHDGRYERVAHLRPFRLPGGDGAPREGWRAAAAMDRASREVDAPWCTSVGRLFDAVAWSAGVCDRSRFAGESALLLEAAIDGGESEGYPFGDGIEGDWQPLLAEVRRDRDCGVATGTIAGKFHLSLVEWIGRVAARLQIGAVVLSGGVFQNAFLADRAAAELRSRGHAVHTHRRVPANDGGLSLGQLAVARQQMGG